MGGLKKWCKYVVIMFINVFTGKTVINLGESTYIVAGNVVKKIK